MRQSLWKGSISFGLINIPVNVQSAEEDRDLHFHMLDERNLAPIKYQKINGKTGKEVPYEKIVKGFEYEKNKYIIMTADDFKRANPKATQTIDIEAIVNLEDIDLTLFERPYYLVPQKGGEKGYFLLQEALNKSKKAAIAKVVMHTKQHLCCIFPRGDYLMLENLRFSHQIREASDVQYLKGAKAKAKFKPQELKMAEQLIHSMTQKWDPDQYEDTYYDDIMAHIHARIKAGKGKHVEDVKEIDTEVETKPTKTKDLMAMLKASLKEGTAQKKKSGSKKSSAKKTAKNQPSAGLVAKKKSASKKSGHHPVH